MFGLLVAVIYLCFISLGLPDSLLGAAWPQIYIDFNVPLSYQGILSMTIAVCTIISSLFSDFLTKKFGPAKVTTVSIFLTASALIGFSFANNFWILLLIGIPYGLGAGAIDAALNNYVALHFKPRMMSWLHCMWGVGASISPYIMGYALSTSKGWSNGYLIVGCIQIVICIISFISIPLWKKFDKVGISKEEDNKITTRKKALTPKEIVHIKGAIPGFITFFCYCALESTTIAWGSSYLVINNELSKDLAANFASLFVIGITIGRFINGFIANKIHDWNIIRMGQCIIVVGLILVFIPNNNYLTIIGLVIMGLGCAPIYPSIIHMTPTVYGKENSQAMIGVQMASAYLGSCFMPPLFGLIANNFTISFFPFYILIFLSLMIIANETVVRTAINKK
ncbi:MAG: MFS transporter [Bacilli bacterium]